MRPPSNYLITITHDDGHTQTREVTGFRGAAELLGCSTGHLVNLNLLGKPRRWTLDGATFTLLITRIP